MCAAHYKQNAALIPEFIKKLHAKELPKGCSPQNLRYFHVQTYHSVGGAVPVLPLTKDHLGYKLLPEESIFMLQTIPSEEHPAHCWFFMIAVAPLL